MALLLHHIPFVIRYFDERKKNADSLLFLKTGLVCTSVLKLNELKP